MVALISGVLTGMGPVETGPNEVFFLVMLSNCLVGFCGEKKITYLEVKVTHLCKELANSTYLHRNYVECIVSYTNAWERSL